MRQLFFSVEDGLINQVFFDKLGWLSVPTNFLANADIAKVFQTFFLSVWKNCGWSAIIYLAAITGIDQSLYEAAKVDGAGRIKRIIYITIPGIMPTFIVLLVLGAANILNTGFDQYYVFTNAVTLPVLDNLDTYNLSNWNTKPEFFICDSSRYEPLNCECITSDRN